MCDRCPRPRQTTLGCHGGAPSPYYADRAEETSTCPRRHLRNNPDLGAVFDLWRLHGGAPTSGLAVTEQLTAAALDALAVMDSAVSYRREQEHALAMAEAKAKARQ
jgi:hypothetical protein